MTTPHPEGKYIASQHWDEGKGGSAQYETYLEMISTSSWLFEFNLQYFLLPLPWQSDCSLLQLTHANRMMTKYISGKHMYVELPWPSDCSLLQLMQANRMMTKYISGKHMYVELPWLSDCSLLQLMRAKCYNQAFRKSHDRMSDWVREWEFEWEFEL